MNKSNNEILIKGNEEIVRALKDFNEFVNLPLGGEIWSSNSDGSEIPGTKRAETPEDRIDFIQSEWFKVCETLYDLGIDLDEEKIEPYSNNNHYEIYGDLVKCIQVAHDSGEIAELSFNGVNITYNEVGIEDNGKGDSVIMLYREGINDENTGDEVARILLHGTKEYKSIISDSPYSMYIEVE